MTENNDLKNKICEFAELRCLLFDKMTNEHNIIDDMSFNLAPRLGTIELNGHEWSFFKHGNGYQFKDESNTVIDIADYFISPTYFNQWELQFYLQSLGTKFIRKHCQGNVESFLENSIQNLDYLRVKEYNLYMLTTDS